MSPRAKAPQKRLLVLDSCGGCPFKKEERTPGAGYAIDWLCSKSENRTIRGYIEWPSEEPKAGEFPKWCPLPIKKRAAPRKG